MMTEYVFNKAYAIKLANAYARVAGRGATVWDEGDSGWRIEIPANLTKADCDAIQSLLGAGIRGRALNREAVEARKKYPA